MKEHIWNIDSKILKQIQDTLYEICGISINDTRQTMIQNRINVLQKESICSNIKTLDELLSLVKTNAQVRQSFINTFTTNKTDLFREAYHFNDMLNRSLIPLLRSNSPIKIFCSASSSGEEPYSIATTCIYAKALYRSSSTIRIIATDIDTSMLELAKKGEYILDSRLNKIPDWVEIDKYFDIVKKLPQGVLSLRAKSTLKSMITFQQLNLFNRNYPFGSGEFDLVFCRNVLIYFKPKDQESILAKLHNVLKVGGTLYLGHSEDILNLVVYFERLGNKMFLRKQTQAISVL